MHVVVDASSIVRRTTKESFLIPRYARAFIPITHSYAPYHLASASLEATADLLALRTAFFTGAVFFFGDALVVFFATTGLGVVFVFTGAAVAADANGFGRDGKLGAAGAGAAVFFAVFFTGAAVFFTGAGVARFNRAFTCMGT